MMQIRLCALYLVMSSTLFAQNKEKTKPDPQRQAAAHVEQILQETATWSSLFNGTDLTGWTGDTSKYVVEVRFACLPKRWQTIVHRHAVQRLCIHI